MVECDYCGDEVRKTEGKMMVLQSGEKLYFCSSKCEKNYSQKRSHRYPEKK